MLKFSGSSYMISGQGLEGVALRQKAPRRLPREGGACERRDARSRRPGQVTGVVSGRTYHTALVSGRPERGGRDLRRAFSSPETERAGLFANHS